MSEQSPEPRNDIVRIDRIIRPEFDRFILADGGAVSLRRSTDAAYVAALSLDDINPPLLHFAVSARLKQFRESRSQSRRNYVGNILSFVNANGIVLPDDARLSNRWNDDYIDTWLNQAWSLSRTGGADQSGQFWTLADFRHVGKVLWKNHRDAKRQAQEWDEQTDLFEIVMQETGAGTVGEVVSLLRGAV